MTVYDFLEPTLPVRRVVRATVLGKGLLEVADGRIDGGDRVDVEFIFLARLDAVSREDLLELVVECRALVCC